MRPVLVFWLFATAVGLVVCLGAGYLVVRGPFLGEALLSPVPLMVATGAFVAGIIGFALGATKVVRIIADGR